VSAALERRSSTWPVTGIETIAPAAMHSSAAPIAPFEISSRSWTNGIWATQVPIIAPFTKKAPKVAVRGVTRPRDPRAAAMAPTNGGH
jgi:hypothetical protein